ncbi:hypothetical protein ACHAWF_010275 [Thalassiosira exigua]
MATNADGRRRPPTSTAGGEDFEGTTRTRTRTRKRRRAAPPAPRAAALALTLAALAAAPRSRAAAAAAGAADARRPREARTARTRDEPNARSVAERRRDRVRRRRDLQGTNGGGSGLFVGSSVDVDACYAHLSAADGDSDGVLTPAEFLTFVQLSAEGKLDFNRWGMPVADFYQLPSEFVGVYNYFACGNANYGCPTVAGIDVGGAKEALLEEAADGEGGGQTMPAQQEATLFQLCKVADGAVGKLTSRPTASPAAAPSPGEGGTGSPTAFDVGGASSPTSAPTSAPAVAGGLPACPPLYDPAVASSYGAGDRISIALGSGANDDNDGGGASPGGSSSSGWDVLQSALEAGDLGASSLGPEGDADAAEEATPSASHLHFECRPFPEGGWCSQAAYEPAAESSAPGATTVWDQAWTALGPCRAPEGEGEAVPAPTTAVPPVDATGTTTAAPPATEAEATVVATSGATEPAGGEATEAAADTTGATEPAVPIATTAATAAATSTAPAAAATVATVATVAAASTRPTDGAGEGGDEDEIYTGPLSVSFEYDIYNLLGLTASSIQSGTAPPNNVMEVLEEATEAFVRDVAAVAFGEGGGGGEGEAGAEVHEKDNVETFEGQNPSETKGKTLFGDGRRGLRGLADRSTARGADLASRPSPRGLRVLLPPGSASISSVADVRCSDPALPAPGGICQRVVAGANFILFAEPSAEDVELRFNAAARRALEDPGVTFPQGSGIYYAGPVATSEVTAVPGATDPGFPTGESPPGRDEGGGTPGWVVPVSIAAAALGSIVLLFGFAAHRQKRRRTGKEYDGHADGRSRGRSPFGGGPDDLGPGDDGRRRSSEESYEAEIRLGGQPSKVSPLEDSPFGSQLADLESGLRKDIANAESRGLTGSSKKKGNNPFMDDSDSESSSSSSSSSSSGMSGSVASLSSSSSTSESDSNEDIPNSNSNSNSDSPDSGGDPKEFWKNKEADAELERQRQYHHQQHELGPHRELGPLGFSRSLHTLHEMSEEELSLKSGYSTSAETSRSDKSVYRAGVEALVKEACPERYDKIDEMMLEYEGREEVLIGHLSTMLAAKNRENASESETDDETEGEEDPAHPRGYGASTLSSLGSRRSALGPMAHSASSEESGADARSPPPRKGSGRDDQTSSAREKEGGRRSEFSAAVAAAGSASAAAAAAALYSDHDSDSDSDSDDGSDSSSSDGSSGWSSDDGFSSIDTSSLATTETEGQPGSLSGVGLATSVGDLSVTRRLGAGTGYAGAGSNPMFLPADGPGDGDGPPPRPAATRADLDEAIQAGDWRAVGATAALIANREDGGDGPSARSREDLNASSLSVTSQEKDQVHELEQLVEAGDWSAVMDAATRFESASDAGLMDSRHNMFEDSNKSGMVRSEEIRLSSSSSSSSSKSSGGKELRTEITELVKDVVPEELENLDEMFLQFRGREEELVETLETMQRQQVASGGGSLGDSVSIFESDNENSTAGTSGNRRGSADRAAMDSTIDTLPEETIVCSRCSKHLPLSEFGKTQLAKVDNAKCHECVLLSL